MKDPLEVRAVHVLLFRGEQVLIEAEAFIGAYAVHLRVFGGKAVGPGYAVTHRATGLMVWRVLLFSEALQVARWLDEGQVCPAEREPMLQWRDSLTPHQRAQFLAGLTAIAPRYEPHPGMDA